MAASDTESSTDPMHLAIVGGGVAGCEAASWAATHGVEVTLLNCGLPLGGSCIHTGTLPVRLLMSAATDYHRARQPRFEGLETAANALDWGALQQMRQSLSDDFGRHYHAFFSSQPGVEVIDELAYFSDPNTLRAGDRVITPDRVLLTPGSHSLWPDIDGLKEAGPLSLQSLNEESSRPASLVFLEISDVALVYAQSLARMGTEVTILTHQSRLLNGEHCHDVEAELRSALADDGVQISTEVVITHAERKRDGVRLMGTQADHPAHWEASRFVIVDHRQPRIEGLALQRAQIELSDRGYIVIDESMQTTNPRVFAAGDAIGRGRHAYAAAYDAIRAAQNAVQPSRTAGHNTAVPFAIYTDPQVAGVGWNEHQARAAGFTADVARFDMSELPSSHAVGSRRGFIKLIRDQRSDRLLGARIISAQGSELIMELTLAVRYGLTVAELATLVHPPISLNESIGRAARSFAPLSDHQSPHPHRGL